LRSLLDVQSWLPADVYEWMNTLPYWYEDDHAIYVHAGLQGEGKTWKHPRDCGPMNLLWMREPDFYRLYEGKRLGVGHTPVAQRPIDHIGPIRRLLFDDPYDVWHRGPLIGLDTGCGKGGFLSAVELPALEIYESR